MRVAIFVDAGYLFAQGSTALAGAKRQRSELRLNAAAAIEELVNVARRRAADQSLLRIYWYDGAINYRGPTLEQTALANLENVKLRLGFVNSQGQQKGVDSLIVTDLIDLGRNHAISDAVLLSGDEDVRIGVQIAQNFGVRVHLIGIAPSRGSQSKLLIQEADTTTEWDRETVSKFLALTQPVVKEASSAPTERQNIAPTVAPLKPSTVIAADVAPVLTSIVDEIVGSLEENQVSDLKLHWTSLNSIPSEFDGKLIAKARDAIERVLDNDEKKYVRHLFRSRVEKL